MPMILIGCDGGTNASSGVVPELTRKLYDLTVSGQIDAARQIQYDLVQLFDMMLYQAEFPNGFRAAVELRGFNMGIGRQPQSSEQQTDLELLSRSIQCMLAGQGFTDEPVGGCRAGDALTDGGLDAQEIGKIVQSVMAELKNRGMA